MTTQEQVKIALKLLAQTWGWQRATLKDIYYMKFRERKNAIILQDFEGYFGNMITSIKQSYLDHVGIIRKQFMKILIANGATKIKPRVSRSFTVYQDNMNRVLDIIAMQIQQMYYKHLKGKQ